MVRLAMVAEGRKGMGRQQVCVELFGGVVDAGIGVSRLSVREIYGESISRSRVSSQAHLVIC
eukprot:3467514-Rhodomonas_salina.1